MQVNVSAKIKVCSDHALTSTLSLYKKGLQHCIYIAWKKGIKNNIKLHPFVYTHLRSIGLQSQLAISCIKQACGMVKKAKTIPIIRFTSMRYNFPRSANLSGNTLSLATIEGRKKFKVTIPLCFQEYFSKYTLVESLLKIDKKGRTFFVFCFSTEVTPRNDLHILGVDLGISNLAVCSDGRFFKSSRVKQIKRKYQYLRSTLQAKGTKSAKRLLRKISGREKRFMADVNHCVSKRIVEGFRGSTIILENLKGIRTKRRGKRINRMIHGWSFFQLQSFIEYKGNREGIVIKRVNPMYTSKLCHRCGVLGSRTSGSFSCHCGLTHFSADLNAARNLSLPMLVKRQAAVIQPHVGDDDVEHQRSPFTSPRALAVGL